jgi:hypothetical protein
VLSALDGVFLVVGVFSDCFFELDLAADLGVDVVVGVLGAGDFVTETLEGDLAGV